MTTYWAAETAYAYAQDAIASAFRNFKLYLWTKIVCGNCVNYRMISETFRIISKCFENIRAIILRENRYSNLCNDNLNLMSENDRSIRIHVPEAFVSSVILDNGYNTRADFKDTIGLCFTVAAKWPHKKKPIKWVCGKQRTELDSTIRQTGIRLRRDATCIL